MDIKAFQQDLVNYGTGGLKVEVYDNSVSFPIKDAIVSVVGENGESFSQRTDVSGQTSVVYLTTPPLYLSESPSDIRPYSTAEVTVAKEGMSTEIISGVQILPDSIAILRVYLQNDNEIRRINITPAKLFEPLEPKIYEDEVKPIKKETGFVVLDSVVIPEYIVVHDGSPDDNSAPNYYIPYKDYIKNVASSEVYSTWELEAIRANVLAIISFTLNRVFTEWYRNKGKNFTITSSTATDHYFVYGRNIYEEISRVVDELFATYIKREGNRQPLLAQYCDGQNVSCPGWMTQWGTQYLAQQGYNAIDILRYFYGDDIYLTTAEKISGVPYSYPGEDLTIGSQGEAVRTIQTQLNVISGTYSAITPVAVDGIYGNETAASVRQFQEIFNLAATGEVEYATWYQISQLFVSIARLAK